jgi:hypothetical protein
MFDKTKTEKNEDKFFTLHDNINNQLKASTFYYNHGDKFYREYSDFISKLSQTFEGLKSYNQTNLASLIERQEQAATKAHNDEVFAANAEETIRVKSEELTNETRVFEEARTNFAKELQALDAKKLAKLKVKDQTQLQNFFGSLHRVFYADSADAFDWAKFKTAFEKDKLKDLRERLTNPKFGTITSDQISSIEKIRDDPYYTELAKNPKEGSSILPLLNYFRWFADAARANEKTTALTAEVANIRLDAPRRAESAKTEATLAAELKRSIQYMEELNSRLVRSADPFADEAKRIHRAGEEYDQHKAQLRTILSEEYESVQHIPRTVYSS